MVEKFDVAIVGGGHNGLTTGAYLAKAGLKVVVLERRDIVGGGCVTEEVTLPGFKHNTASNFHGWIHFGPVYRDLELEKFGLKYTFPGTAFGNVFTDDTGFIAYRYMSGILEQLGKFSQHDAQAFLQLRKEFEVFKDVLKGFLFSPPAQPSAFPAMLQGSPAGRELLRFSLSNAKNIINERFENDKIKGFLLLQITMAGIAHDVYGSGLFVPVMATLEGGWGLAVGGSGSLAHALIRCIEEHGGSVRTNSHVEKIVVEKGAARGIVLSDGSEILVNKAIASNVEPQQTLLKMVGRQDLPEDVVKQAERWRASEMAFFSMHLALNEPPKWKAAEFCPDLNKCWGVAAGFDSPRVLDSQFADIRLGIPVRDLAFTFITPTLYDPSQAPEGKHTGVFWLYNCYDLKDGGPERWDSIKEEYADLCIEAIQRYAPNIDSSNILARDVITPLDLERKNISMIKGDLSAGELSQEQMGIFRPIHGYPPYRTPIKGLYFCGPSAHPGGNVSGACGYNAVNAMADDLGLKKWWIKK